MSNGPGEIAGIKTQKTKLCRVRLEPELEETAALWPAAKRFGLALKLDRWAQTVENQRPDYDFGRARSEGAAGFGTVSAAAEGGLELASLESVSASTVHLSSGKRCCNSTYAHTILAGSVHVAKNRVK